MNHYEYRHLVTFQETNVVGNVYYTHYLAWQGRCRELFLNEYAPEILSDLDKGLSLATVRCSCEYFMELEAFDEVIVRMKLAEQVQNHITLAFEYGRARDGTEELVARGEQQVASMRREGARLVPAPLPAALREALVPYAGNGSS